MLVWKKKKVVNISSYEFSTRKIIKSSLIRTATRVCKTFTPGEGRWVINASKTTRRYASAISRSGRARAFTVIIICHKYLLRHERSLSRARWRSLVLYSTTRALYRPTLYRPLNYISGLLFAFRSTGGDSDELNFFLFVKTNWLFIARWVVAHLWHWIMGVGNEGSANFKGKEWTFVYKNKNASKKTLNSREKTDQHSGSLDDAAPLVKLQRPQNR